MRFLPLIALPLAMAVSACEASVSRISQAAESARSATERSAASSLAASDAREAQIYADAHDIEERAAARAGLETSPPPQYEIRKDGDSWTVYDTANRRPVRVGPKLQSGLSHEDAEAAFKALVNDKAGANASVGAAHMDAITHQ